MHAYRNDYMFQDPFPQQRLILIHSMWIKTEFTSTMSANIVQDIWWPLSHGSCHIQTSSINITHFKIHALCLSNPKMTQHSGGPLYNFIPIFLQMFSPFQESPITSSWTSKHLRALFLLHSLWPHLFLQTHILPDQLPFYRNYRPS